jgi:hypothetical protein
VFPQLKEVPLWLDKGRCHEFYALIIKKKFNRLLAAQSNSFQIIFV